jgi:hypothetical protein
MREIVACVFMVGALVVACTGSSSSQSAADASTPTYGASACGTCVASACDASYKQCDADPGCAPYLGCLIKCPVGASGDVDASCEAACPSTSGTAQGLRDALTSCRTLGGGASCGACGGTDGGANVAATIPVLNQMCTPATSADTCNKCKVNECCNSESACLSDPECTAYRTCLNTAGADGGACPGANDVGIAQCKLDCAKAHPNGVQKYAARVACMFYYCDYVDPTAHCFANPLTPCVRCQFQNCLKSFVDCQADGTCGLFEACIVVCGGATDACVASCTAAYPSARPLFDAETTCSLAACVGVCGG